MRRLAIPLLAAAALATTAGAASAHVLPGRGTYRLAALPVSASAITLLENAPDNGHGTPSEWALDTMWRSVTVTRGAPADGTDCGLASSASCWAYSASLSDSGNFTTIPGAGTPNQSCAGCAGEKVKSPAVRGSLSGAYQITFYASSGTPDRFLVPAVHDDHGVAASPPFTSTSWPELFFPTGTSFGHLTGGAYQWTYMVAAGGLPVRVETWTDSSVNGDGNEPQDGNITG